MNDLKVSYLAFPLLHADRLDWQINSKAKCDTSSIVPTQYKFNLGLHSKQLLT